MDPWPGSLYLLQRLVGHHLVSVLVILGRNRNGTKIDKHVVDILYADVIRSLAGNELPMIFGGCTSWNITTSARLSF